ncbi:MAG: hypothetical protein ACJ8DI_27290 [Ktedonobacteraceae bacterium]
MEGTYKLCYGISLPASIAAARDRSTCPPDKVLLYTPDARSACIVVMTLAVIMHTSYRALYLLPPLDTPPLVWYNAGDSK